MFHAFLAARLEDCFARNVRRICISVPPQHGKSRLTSILFPAWALTKAPTSRIIQTGYSGDLSEGFTREARTLVRSPGYLKLFPEMATGVDRAGEWHTKLGGYYMATSTGGGGTGRGADILIVDDPFKNAEDAGSKKIRDHVWEMFATTFLTRLSPDGIVIVVHTRWNEDDLIGRLTNPERVRDLKDKGLGEFNYEVINIEAICEDPAKDPLGRSVGEPLWPEGKPLKALQVSKAEMTVAQWNALYQGKPNPPGGRLCDTTKIDYINRDQVPADLKLMRCWDLSLGDDPESDYSCGAYGGVVKRTDQATGKPVFDFYLVHMDRGKRKWPQQKARIISCAEAESNGGDIGLESVAAWKVAVDELNIYFQGRTLCRGYNPVKNKADRAQPWLGLIDNGRFHIVRGTWNQEFKDELEQFPNGLHDDQIDAVSTLWYTYRLGGRLVLA